MHKWHPGARCYVNYQQDSWADNLPFMEVAYNNTVHSSTGFTLFFTPGQDFMVIPELQQINLQNISLTD